MESKLIYTYSLWGLNPIMLTIVATLAIFAISLCLSYRKQGLVKSLVTALLRSLATALIVYLCFGPKFLKKEKLTVKPASSVLLDSSISMFSQSTQPATTRYKQSLDFAEETVIKKFCSTEKVERYQFSSEVTNQPVNSKFQAVKKPGSNTDISLALEAPLSASPNTPGTVILLSDGNWNAGFDPVETAQAIRDAGGIVHCFYPDEVDDTKASQTTPSHPGKLQLYLCGNMILSDSTQPFSPAIIVVNPSSQATHLTVTATFNNKTFTEKITFNWGEMIKSCKAIFPIPDTAGNYQLQVAVATTNATLPSVVKAEMPITVTPKMEKTKRKRSVLYLDSGLRYQYRFLTDILMINSSFKTNAYMLLDNSKKELAKASGLTDFFSEDKTTWIHNAEKLKSAPADSFLNTSKLDKQIDASNIIIIGKLQTQIIDNELCRKIMTQTQQGANLFLTISPSTIKQLSKTPFAALVNTDKPLQTIKRARLDNQKDNQRFDTLLNIPKRLPFMAVYKFDKSFTHNFTPVLFARDLKQGDSKRYPLVYKQAYGLGNVYLIMSDQLWHIPVGQQGQHVDFYEQFINSLLLHDIFSPPALKIYCAEPYTFTNKDIKLSFDQNLPSAKLEVLNYFWPQISPKEQSLKSQAKQATISRKLATPGYYDLCIKNSKSGELESKYRVVCLKPLAKAKPEQQYAAEKPTTKVNLKALQAIAKAGSGLCLPFTKAGKLKAIPGLKDVYITKTTETMLMDKYWWLLIIIFAILSVEWVIRKK